MLQRKQTLYMLVSILMMVCFYFFFPEVIDETGLVLFEKNQPLVLGLIIAPVLLIFISIFNYKNRKLQFVINRIAIVLNFVLLGVFVFQSQIVSGGTFVPKKGIGVLFPIISIVFLAMANKAIKRDEDLVKSVDRLR